MDTTAINQSIIRERNKLARQRDAVKATEALLAMLEKEATKLTTK